MSECSGFDKAYEAELLLSDFDSWVEDVRSEECGRLRRKLGDLCETAGPAFEETFQRIAARISALPRAAVEEAGDGSSRAELAAGLERLLESASGGTDT
jgi:hypothetical protein